MTCPTAICSSVTLPMAGRSSARFHMRSPAPPAISMATSSSSSPHSRAPVASISTIAIHSLAAPRPSVTWMTSRGNDSTPATFGNGFDVLVVDREGAAPIVITGTAQGLRR